MNNPYLTIEGCVDRLYREYQKHPKLIVAVDHDDTVFDFHKKSYDYSDTVSAVRRASQLGFYIVVFTGTEKEKWQGIFDYWDNVLKIKITGINANPVPLPFGNDGKIYYNILLDDRAGLSQSIEILNRLIDKIELKQFYNESQIIVGVSEHQCEVVDNKGKHCPNNPEFLVNHCGKIVNLCKTCYTSWSNGAYDEPGTIEGTLKAFKKLIEPL